MITMIADNTNSDPSHKDIGEKRYGFDYEQTLVQIWKDKLVIRTREVLSA
jgi:hypothetical protein